MVDLEQRRSGWRWMMLLADDWLPKMVVVVATIGRNNSCGY